MDLELAPGVPAPSRPSVGSPDINPPSNTAHDARSPAPLADPPAPTPPGWQGTLPAAFLESERAAGEPVAFVSADWRKQACVRVDSASALVGQLEKVGQTGAAGFGVREDGTIYHAATERNAYLRLTPRDAAHPARLQEAADRHFAARDSVSVASDPRTLSPPEHDGGRGILGAKRYPELADVREGAALAAGRQGFGQMPGSSTSGTAELRSRLAQLSQGFGGGPLSAPGGGDRLAAEADAQAAAAAGFAAGSAPGQGHRLTEELESLRAGRLATDPRPVNPDVFSPRGPAYRQSQLVANTHYDDPIAHLDDTLSGNSRRAGDATLYVQRRAMDAIIASGRDHGMSDREIALTLAIARLESGFNPDAAAGTSSASGLGQLTDATATAYGIDDGNHWSLEVQADALVRLTQTNMAHVIAHGHGGADLERYTYAYHHDGPSASESTYQSTGLPIADRDVVPRVELYLEYIRRY